MDIDTEHRTTHVKGNLTLVSQSYDSELSIQKCGSKAVNARSSAIRS